MGTGGSTIGRSGDGGYTGCNDSKQSLVVCDVDYLTYMVDMSSPESGIGHFDYIRDWTHTLDNGSR